MIFSIGDHIQLILTRRKTQTRRQSGRYRINQLYTIQPSRTSKGIPEGKIEIIDKRLETWGPLISPSDAQAEGGYTPEAFEEFYYNLHPRWCVRYAYTFRFIPNRKAVGVSP